MDNNRSLFRSLAHILEHNIFYNNVHGRTRMLLTHASSALGRVLK